MAKKDRTKSTPKSDERNVVSADKVDLQDIEDQIVMIWEKNKGLIFGGIALVFALFIGFQGYKYYQKQALESLQESYRSIESPAEKVAWANENAGNPLGAFAFKELGDDAYAAGDFATAESYYREALESAKVPVEGAAQIALAVTLIEQAQTDEAKQLLQNIADDPKALNRAEAQYRLAQLAQSEGDAERARSLIEAIDAGAIFWKSRARALEAELPQSGA